MLLKGTKGYFKEKYLKYDRKRSYYYDGIIRFFDINGKYIIKNKKIYELKKQFNILSKKEIEKKYGIDFFQNFVLNQKIKKQDKLSKYISLHDLYKVPVRIKKELNFEELNLNVFSKIFFNEKTFITVGNLFTGEKFIKIKDIFGNYDIFKSEILKKYNQEILNKIIFDIFSRTYLNEYIIDLIKEKINLETKYNHFYIDENTKYKLLLNLENFCLFSIENGEQELKLLNDSKNHYEILKHLTIQENIEFNGKEIYQKINKNSELEKIKRRSYYSKPAPKWYRKKENKIFKLKNKKELLNGNLENINTLKSKKNASYYW